MKGFHLGLLTPFGRRQAGDSTAEFNLQSLEENFPVGKTSDVWLLSVQNAAYRERGMIQRLTQCQ
jgi:hypothetical protein